MITGLCKMACWAALLVLAGCAPRPPASYQGYIEGEFVYVAPPLGGQLTNLAVARGTEVAAGQLLFVLEASAEASGVREAEEKLAQAGARLEDLKKGKRPTELASLEAQLKVAQANLELARLEWNRQSRLQKDQVISEQEWEIARARLAVEEARVNSLKADLETARLGARTDAVKAAEAEEQGARAALAKAQWALTQKRQAAPAAAWVQDTLYREGEYVTAGSPVVSLLSPGNLKVRFFVPQAQLPSIRRGAQVQVRLDGLAAPLNATIQYISAREEFTPPVIYSQENRAKLVFMVEAGFGPVPAAGLKPGQPADVRLVP